MHLLHEELERVPELQKLRSDIRRALRDRGERIADLPLAVVVPERLERGGIFPVDRVCKGMSQPSDCHFVGDLIRLRPDTYSAAQLRT